MPRYVILEHDHPFRHWDLMLEAGLALRTWRLHAPPTVDTTSAELLGPHRLAYLDYEGPVSGNRGTVCRTEAGSFAWHIDSPDLVVVVLDQTRRLTLRRDGDLWSATFTPESPS